MSPKEEYSKLLGWNLLTLCRKINLNEDNNQFIKKQISTQIKDDLKM